MYAKSSIRKWKARTWNGNREWFANGSRANGNREPGTGTGDGFANALYANGKREPGTGTGNALQTVRVQTGTGNQEPGTGTGNDM